MYFIILYFNYLYLYLYFILNINIYFIYIIVAQVCGAFYIGNEWCVLYALFFILFDHMSHVYVHYSAQDPGVECSFGAESVAFKQEFLTRSVPENQRETFCVYKVRPNFFSVLTSVCGMV